MIENPEEQKCPLCGYVNLKTAKMCVKCNCALSSQGKNEAGPAAENPNLDWSRTADYTMKFCPHCGAVNEVNAKKCACCGKKFATSKSSTTRKAIASGAGILWFIWMAVRGGMYYSKHHRYEDRQSEHITSLCSRPHQPLTYDFIEDGNGGGYGTLTADGKEWMTENLAVTKDRYGNDLELGVDYYYPEGNAENVERYGLWYTWDAAKKACPQGWHLATQADWEFLEKYCTDCYSFSAEHGDIARTLAATSDWNHSDSLFSVGSDLTANDTTRFSALPAGLLLEEGNVAIGDIASFWMDREFDDGLVGNCSLLYSSPKILFAKTEKSSAMSVRCVRD